MILRTPPLRKRKTDSAETDFSPENLIPDRPLVIYEEPLPESSHDPSSSSEQMLCTYQCRQMVISLFPKSHSHFVKIRVFSTVLFEFIGS